MLDNIKTNWAAMSDGQRRKILLGVFIAALLIGLFLSIPERNAGGPRATNNKESADNTVDLKTAPDNKWLARATKNSAASDRVKLKGQIDQLTERLVNYQDGTSSDLGEIKESISALTRASQEWELDVAEERAQRKAADKLIISNISNIVGTGSGGVVMNPTGVMPALNGDVSYSNAADTLGITEGPSKPKPESSILKVSAFDMFKIARMNRLSLDSRNSSSNQNPNGSAVSSSVEDVSNNDFPTNQHIDRMGNVDGNIEYGDGKIKLQNNKKVLKTLVTVPTGSVIQARLVTGLNAVIANTADSDKLIVLAKLTDPILFPNHKKVSLRGCTIMGGGKGDISTERVYINSTILSCIDSDDVLYEAAVRSNAIGEDGVLGLRGRPVTKDGALLMQSVGTGLIQGFASAFSGASQQPQIISNTDGNYALPSMDYVGKSALAGGIDKGLEQMVDRANNLLDQIFPVLEIDAGRTIEFVVQQKFELKEI